MGLRLPTAEELKQLAAANHFTLSPEELADFQSMLPEMFQSLDKLDRMPVPVAPLKYPERERGFRPEPKDDPLNAIIRRCSVRGAKSGKLAGKSR